MQTLVRAFVIALALTGAVASAHTSNSDLAATPIMTRTSALPVPSCPPSDPDACGMGRNGGFSPR